MIVADPECRSELKGYLPFARGGVGDPGAGEVSGGRATPHFPERSSLGLSGAESARPPGAGRGVKRVNPDQGCINCSLRPLLFSPPLGPSPCPPSPPPSWQPEPSLVLLDSGRVSGKPFRVSPGFGLSWRERLQVQANPSRSGPTTPPPRPLHSFPSSRRRPAGPGLFLGSVPAPVPQLGEKGTWDWPKKVNPSSCSRPYLRFGRGRGCGCSWGLADCLVRDSGSQSWGKRGQLWLWRVKPRSDWAAPY